MCNSAAATNVRAELARHHVTQSTLTVLLGLSHSAVSRRVRGETPFRDTELIRIAEHLGVPITALFGTS